MERKKHDENESMILKGVAEGLRELQRVRHLSDKAMGEDMFGRSEATFVGYKYKANGLGLVDLYNLCNNEGVCLDRLVGLRKEYNLFRAGMNPPSRIELALELENILYNIDTKGSDVDQVQAAIRCAPWFAKWLEQYRKYLG